jgi:Flp pilus assembly protein TadG
MLEMALCMPVLLLVVTGIFTFGIMLDNDLILTNAVTIGAQQLAINRGQTTNPCAVVVAAVNAATPTLMHGNYGFSIVLNGTTYPGTTCSSSSTTTGAAGNMVQGTAAQVTVTYPCSMAVYGGNLAPSCSLKAQTTELVQ